MEVVKDFCLVDGVYWCGAVGVIETNYGLGVGMRRSRDVKGVGGSMIIIVEIRGNEFGLKGGRRKCVMGCRSLLSSLFHVKFSSYCSTYPQC